MGEQAVIANIDPEHGEDGSNGCKQHARPTEEVRNQGQQRYKMAKRHHDHYNWPSGDWKQRIEFVGAHHVSHWMSCPKRTLQTFTLSLIRKKNIAGCKSAAIV